MSSLPQHFLWPIHVKTLPGMYWTFAFLVWELFFLSDQIIMTKLPTKNLPGLAIHSIWPPVIGPEVSTWQCGPLKSSSPFVFQFRSWNTGPCLRAHRGKGVSVEAGTSTGERLIQSREDQKQAQLEEENPNNFVWVPKLNYGLKLHSLVKWHNEFPFLLGDFDLDLYHLYKEAPI